MKEIIEHTQYINGEMDEESIYLLWIEFLKKPERFNRYITLVNLHALARKKSGTC